MGDAPKNTFSTSGTNIQKSTPKNKKTVRDFSDGRFRKTIMHPTSSTEQVPKLMLTKEEYQQS